MYTILFTDNTLYRAGKDLRISNWNMMPAKPIRKIDYTINNHTVTLDSYEQYNHLIEKANIGGKTYITKIILMGRKNNTVDCFIYDFKTKVWDETVAEFGAEYNNKSTTGWKQGISIIASPC
jgi:hypothetical protein